MEPFFCFCVKKFSIPAPILWCHVDLQYQLNYCYLSYWREHKKSGMIHAMFHASVLPYFSAFFLSFIPLCFHIASMLMCFHSSYLLVFTWQIWYVVYFLAYTDCYLSGLNCANPLTLVNHLLCDIDKTFPPTMVVLKCK